MSTKFIRENKHRANTCITARTNVFNLIVAMLQQPMQQFYMLQCWNVPTCRIFTSILPSLHLHVFSLLSGNVISIRKF